MATNECIPFYDDGDNISAYCDDAVTGKTFVKISQTRSGGTFNPASTTAGDGGMPHVETADVHGRVFGVAAYDGTAQGSVIDVIRGTKMVVPVTAAAAISAFDEVAVGTGGQVIPTGADTKASLSTGVVANNNAITWTAADGGIIGNSITVTLLNPEADNADLSVEVNELDIVVSLATGSGGAITSTAAQVMAAVTAATTIVTVANDSTSNGSGVVVAVAQTNLAGGAEAATYPAVGYVLADCVLGADAQVSLY